MSKPSPSRYRTTNWSSYNQALRKRGSLLIWLDEEMTWLAPYDGRPGRHAVFSDTAIQFCLTIKVKLPLRQTSGMMASLLKMLDLDWAVPHYTTLCRRQKTLAVQIPYRRVDGPLNLLVDSTGIKFLGDGEWQVRKHGVQGRRQWRKVHLVMDTATSDIRAVAFTPSRERDSSVLPALPDQIPEAEPIGTVTADGAYDTRRCHTAIIERQATAIIPIRNNGRPWKEDCPATGARNETLRATRHYGRAFWKRWSGYHARSRIEAKMRCLKAVGERISARDPDRQTAEIQIRVALMNRFSALGTADIIRVPELKGERGSHASGGSSATTPFQAQNVPSDIPCLRQISAHSRRQALKARCIDAKLGDTAHRPVVQSPSRPVVQSSIMSRPNRQ